MREKCAQAQDGAISSNSACVVTRFRNCELSKRKICAFLLSCGKHVKWRKLTLREKKSSGFPICRKTTHELPNIKRWHLGKFDLGGRTKLSDVERIVFT